MKGILSVLPQAEPSLYSATIAICLAVAGVTMCVWRKKTLSGTTLLAPLYWGVAAILSIALSELMIGLFASTDSQRWGAFLRYSASVTTCCPVVAVLGAKRPQDRALANDRLLVMGCLGAPCDPSCFSSS